ncbi:MAG: DUF5681 domain-containing protein [Xanthobacteraceae bacterium]
MSRKPKRGGAGDDGSYRVGYGRPPRHTRFQKGKSGNPRGRKKGRKNLRDVVVSTLEERIWIREGESRRKISKTEALVRTTVNRAIAGDQKAGALLMALMRATNLTSEPPDGPSTTALSQEDDAILADFLNRHDKQQGPKAP